jgi:alpha-1,3-rhamnosyl/mannosyltransferase
MRTVVADVRMLAYPLTGIGRYVFELLRRLTPVAETEWVLLSPLPVPPDVRGAIGGQVRWVEGDGSQKAERWTQRVGARSLRSHPGALFLGLASSVPLFGPKSSRYALVIYDLTHVAIPRLTHRQDLIKGWLFTWPSVRKADLLLTISPAIERELHAWVPRTRGRTVALPPAGTPLVIPREPVPFGERRGFLAVGAHPRKNTPLLVEAYAALPAEIRKRHPLTILSRRFPPGLARTIQRLGSDCHVSLVADAADADLANYYASSLALVYPSVYEGLGLPVAEAMFAGLPSIVAAGSPMAEFLGDGGIAVAPLTASAVSQAMLRLASDVQLWNDRAAAAQREARAISWDAAAATAAEALGLGSGAGAASAAGDRQER